MMGDFDLGAMRDGMYIPSEFLMLDTAIWLVPAVGISIAAILLLHRRSAKRPTSAKPSSRP